MPKLPFGDIGPCEVTWDYNGDNELIITPYLGKVSLRMADAVTDVHIDGQGVAPIESFFEGTTVEFEVPMARSKLAQLAETIGYGCLGTLVGDVLTLHNVAGYEMSRYAKQIVIKPVCNNVPDDDPKTWTLLYKCHPYRDFELGWDRSGQRVHMVKFKVLATSNGGAAGDAYFQQGVFCPPATPAMTGKYEDSALFVEYKALCIFDDKLCIYDHGPNANDGRVLYTEDAGATWPTLFSRTGAQIGYANDWDGKSMAVYDGSLFITKFGLPDSPKVIEWDGTTVNLHLTNPLHDNKMGSNLVVWDEKLWCLTDQTPSPHSDYKRIVYYYDGGWTPVILYDGAAFLNYNKITNLPIWDIMGRTTRLFVFNDELYLIATRYTGTKWAWEVWKFDAVAYDNFTQIYDSDVFDDGNALAAIIEFEDEVKIVGNELVVADGNPSMDGKIYTSADMLIWTVEATLPDLGFPFGEELFRPSPGECLPPLDERFYLNCVNVDPGDNKTCIRYWDEDLGQFTLSQEIATNTHTHGGGLRTFNNALYAGKYKEVYGNSVL